MIEDKFAHLRSLEGSMRRHCRAEGVSEDYWTSYAQMQYDYDMDKEVIEDVRMASSVDSLYY